MKMTRLIFCFAFTLMLAACGKNATDIPSKNLPANADYERGPHGGRLLRDGDFAMEISTYGSKIEPHYRLYAYRQNRLLPPSDIQATLELRRLDGEISPFNFKPENDYLVGDGKIAEPHSFDLKVNAVHGDKSYEWTFASYEGRTTIPEAISKEAGIEIETAAPAVLKEKVQLLGNVVLNSGRYSIIRARFPGTVRAVKVREGDKVKKGQPLLVIEGNDSMRNYSLTAPFDGVVMSRSVSVGDMADNNTLLEIADLSTVWVELHAIGKTAAKLKVGQKVTIMSTTGNDISESSIEALLPVTTRSQSTVLRATLPNADGNWRPGMTVSADVTVSERNVPLAVRESALQRLQGATVVFAQAGNIYESRVLKLGAQDGEFAEVLDGIKPGTNYVTKQSFLVKADIEKSGASHDD